MIYSSKFLEATESLGGFKAIDDLVKPLIFKKRTPMDAGQDRYDAYEWRTTPMYKPSEMLEGIPVSGGINDISIGRMLNLMEKSHNIVHRNEKEGSRFSRFHLLCIPMNIDVKFYKIISRNHASQQEVQPCCEQGRQLHPEAQAQGGGRRC